MLKGQVWRRKFGQRVEKSHGLNWLPPRPTHQSLGPGLADEGRAIPHLPHGHYCAVHPFLPRLPGLCSALSGGSPVQSEEGHGEVENSMNRRAYLANEVVIAPNLTNGMKGL